jgi:sugar lactone lactonase YvrE
MNHTVDMVLDARATLGEGALWDDVSQRLLWVDILEKRVGLLDPSTLDNRMLQLETFVGTVVPAGPGSLMVAVREGFGRLDRESGVLSQVRRPEGHDPAKMRFNDGKCDPAGRFWAGTMALDESGREGALFCLGTDGRIRRMVDQVAISNGIAWSLDQRVMYYIDTLTAAVAAFDYDADTGDIRNRRVAFEVPGKMGWPDGMTIDSEGMLWVALWDGWAVSKWDPRTGRLLEVISLPVARVTSCAFGGPSMDTLFITSARVGISPELMERQPLAGGLFAVHTGSTGRTAFAYRG